MAEALDTAFTDLIAARADQAATAAQAALLLAQRRWFTPGRGLWSGDSFDLPGMSAAFNRARLNADLAAGLAATPPDPQYATTARVLQLEYVAAAERAFRSRRCSSIRARLHAAGRSAGQGHTQGVFKKGTQGYAQNILEQGARDASA